MFNEYAVEPKALGSSPLTFRYLIEKFGFDKGRLIAEFPKHWFREVYDSTAGFSPVEKKRVEEALAQARRNKVVRSKRPYDAEAGDWLHNALTEQQRLPFRAIIAQTNAQGDPSVLLPDDVDDQNPMITAPQTCAVNRDAPSLCAAMLELLKFGKQLVFVDAFFDPFSQRYKDTLRECLRVVKDQNPTSQCEIHYRYHPDGLSQAMIEREARNLFPGVVPAGLNVKIFCWRQKQGGADFHARYLLTDRGGISVDAGFSAEGAQQTTDMHLMDFEFSLGRLSMFAREATAFELVDQVLEIDSAGNVRHA